MGKEGKQKEGRKEGGRGRGGEGRSWGNNRVGAPSSRLQPSQTPAWHLSPELLLKARPQVQGGAPTGRAVLGSLPGFGGDHPSLAQQRHPSS